MEDDPSIETDFFLAECLHRTVAEIRGMSNADYLGWTVYFARKAQRVQLAELQAQAAGGG